MILPLKALSVREPWAWAILYAGKDVENRTAAALRHMNFAGVDRLAIHASQGMTRDEYEEGAVFMALIGVACPPARELSRGGIIGLVDVLGVVAKSESRWFFGPRAILLANPEPCKFIPARGALGLFDWKLGETSWVPSPAKWMLAEPKVRPRPEPEPELPLWSPDAQANATGE